MHDAVIIGGGLAGISAAWELARRDDWNVTLYERADRLGGKAGSEKNGASYYSDHGYHLFPAWYDNVRQLMGEAGIDYDVELIPGERFISKFRGRNEVTGELEGRFFGRWLETVAFAWAIGELIKAEDDYLRSVSLEEFLWDVFIGREKSKRLFEGAKERHGSLTLKALSNTPDKISALTCARMWRRWMNPFANVGKPSWSALRGSLQTRFIAPLETALEEQGVGMNLQSEVRNLEYQQRGGRWVPVRMFLGDSSQPPPEDGAKEKLEEVDLVGKKVFLTVPAEALGRVFEPKTRPDWAKDISKHTDVDVMSAVDCLVAPLVTDSPTDHFGFGPDDLTGFDITRHWLRSELPPVAVRGKAAEKTVVQVIATSNSRRRSQLETYVNGQIATLFDRTPGKGAVTALYTHENTNAPLYLNTVHNSQDRPYFNTPADNGYDDTYIAGDYCDTSIDVASMEAAVASGRLAAEAAVGGTPNIAKPDPKWVSRVLMVGRLSGVFRVVVLLSRLRTKFGGT